MWMRWLKQLIPRLALWGREPEDNYQRGRKAGRRLVAAFRNPNVGYLLDVSPEPSFHFAVGVADSLRANGWADQGPGVYVGCSICHKYIGACACPRADAPGPSAGSDSGDRRE